MRKGTIYSLIDPRTNQIKYIGQTIVKPKRRYDQHIYQWKRSKKLTHVNSWIKNLSKDNLKPILNILENEICEENLNNKEIFYIKKYKDLNFNLYNHTDGGSGCKGYKVSIESKFKRLKSLENSEAWKERSKRHSEIMKQKHKDGLTNFGYKHLTEEKRKEIGRKHSKTMLKLGAEGKLITSNKKVRITKLDNSFSKDFNSLREAAKFLGLKEGTSIGRCCNELQKTIKKEYKAIFINEEKVNLL